MKYAKSTNGFYDEAIHGDNIPADAVEITTEEHAALLEGQSHGNIIVTDENGFPVLSAPPAPTDEELEFRARAERDRLLRETVDTVNAIRWSVMSAAEQSAWTEYRQSLLDVPEQPGFPNDIQWPIAPE